MYYGMQMQDYIHELGSCLLELDGPQQQHAADRIDILTEEAFTLATHRSRFDGKISRPVMTVEADDSNKLPGVLEPDEAFYKTMIVSPLHSQNVYVFQLLSTLSEPLLLLRLLHCLRSKVCLFVKRLCMFTNKQRGCACSFLPAFCVLLSLSSCSASITQEVLHGSHVSFNTACACRQAVN